MSKNGQEALRTQLISISNGTANNCVTETISGSRTANSPQFFMDLISGQNLQQYVNDVFKSAQCTGCMHELYKAA